MPSTLIDYDVIGVCGSGTFGKVKKIQRKKDGKVLVWKEIYYGDMTEVEKAQLVEEVNLLRRLRFEHIVGYYDRIVDKAMSTLYIIMEYCGGGDLAKYIQRHKQQRQMVPEPFVWKVLIQIALALRECHRCDIGRILHRDLKPANILINVDGIVKVGDFGLARTLNHETSFAKTCVGTPFYMSPEQMNSRSYDEKSDIWSLGCLVYELAALDPPFLAQTQTELAGKIRKGSFRPIPNQFSKDLSYVIKRMLATDAAERPDVDSLLADPFVEKSRLKYRATPDLANSSDFESSSTSRHLDIRRMQELTEREAGVAGRESAVSQRELALSSQEETICSREQEAKAKLEQAERMMSCLTTLQHGSLLNVNTPEPCTGLVTNTLPRSSKKASKTKSSSTSNNSDKENENVVFRRHNSSKLDELKARLFRAKLRTLSVRNCNTPEPGAAPLNL